MTTIKAIVRGGRLEVDEPIDLPDGTELLIPLPNGAPIPNNGDDGWDNSPEGIADWLTWYDSLEPLMFTDDERAAADAARQARREWELAQFEALNDGPMTPEEIARVLAAMEKVEPFDIPHEVAHDLDAWERKVVQHGIDHTNEDADS